MSGFWVEILDAHELSDDELVVALEAGAEHESWGRRAAVMLIVGQRSWLYRHEFRQAVEMEASDDGGLWAFVDWAEVDTSAPCSSGEGAILQLARYLAGIPTEQRLWDLLSGLDDRNLIRVLGAVGIAARGRQGTLR